MNPDFTSITHDLVIDKISVLDPDKKVSSIWNNVTFTKGYAQKSMLLEDEPINGKWRILVEYGSRKEETDFVVNEQHKKLFLFQFKEIISLLEMARVQILRLVELFKTL